MPPKVRLVGGGLHDPSSVLAAGEKLGEEGTRQPGMRL